MKKLLVIFLITTLFCLSSCNKITPTNSDKPEPVTSETADITEKNVISKQTDKTEEKEVEVEIEEKEVEKSSEKADDTLKNEKVEKAEESAPEQPISDNEVKKETPPAPQIQENSSLDRTKTGFGYSPNSENKQVSIGQKYENMITNHGGFFIDRRNTKNIYLTMDEGYENGYTAMILDTLKEKGVQCTFFVTQPYVNNNPDLITRMINEGHIVGNHSVNHKSMPTLSDEEVKNEIMGLHNDVLAKFGYSMKYFRPPMGEYSESSLAVTQSLGYRSVFWSFAYRDWETNNFKGKDYAVQNVNNGIHNGCVILLHAVSKDNAEGLGEIIDSLRAKGYIFSSLDNMN